MSQSKPDERPKEPAHTTPGRPTESGSRQQIHPDQSQQTGSGPLDKESTERTNDA